MTRLSRICAAALVAALGFFGSPQGATAGTIDPSLLAGPTQVVIKIFDLGGGNYDLSVLSEISLDGINASIFSRSDIASVNFQGAGPFASTDAGEDIAGSQTLLWSSALGGTAISPNVSTVFALLTGSNLDLNDDPVDLAQMLNIQGVFATSNGGAVDPETVMYMGLAPEPSSLVLMGLGLAGLAFLRRRAV